MKKIAEFVKKEVADDIILVPTGKTAEGFKGLITLSQVGAFIWDALEEVNSFEELIQRILDTYETDQQTAVTDTIEFLNQLLRAGIIRPTDKNW
ncbi:MAG: PqqD family protein [Bacteroidales bacterium]|nr:PqqD family protein [Bacteroidaceae bacterium]MBQ9883469.1 PqqD family protein [Bacteroidaceae bacterium]MDO4186053.1 PqqD family protein [Bacteroidales bacterium]